MFNSNSNHNYDSNHTNDNSHNNASDGQGMVDKAKNMMSSVTGMSSNVPGGMASQGIASTGGAGMGSAGLSGAGMGAAGAGLGAAASQANSRFNTGMGESDRSNPHAYNRDSFHSGYGGHNTNTDTYGRDTTNNETYGRVGQHQDYSMSTDHDPFQNQQRNIAGGNATSSSFATGDLSRGTGIGTHHHATDHDMLGTTATRTGIHSGDGIHAEQYYGRTGDGTAGTTVTGPSTSIGHHQYQTDTMSGTGVGNHQPTQGIHPQQYAGRSGGIGVSETTPATGTGVSHVQQDHQEQRYDQHRIQGEGGRADRETRNTGHTSIATNTNAGNMNTSNLNASNMKASNMKANTAAVPTPSSNQDSLPPYGKTVMTTTTETGTTEGPSPYHLRVGETVVEKETRVHRGLPAGTDSSHQTHTTSHSAAGNTSSARPGEHSHTRKPSLSDKILGKTGKTGEHGTERVTATTRPMN